MLPSWALSQWSQVSDVKLAVYDLLGREVATLAKGRFAAGRYEFAFDGSGLPSGVYVLRVFARGRVMEKTLLLQK
jgi:hypothetical protein